MNNLRIGALVGAVIGVLALFIMVPNILENLSANEVMVIQHVGGSLDCYTTPGPKMQLFGRVTTYPRRGTYDFSNAEEGRDNSKKLRFNDGGHANMYGSVNWEMPLDCARILDLYRNFGTVEGLESKGIAQMIDNAIYLSGPLMSSTESSGERRAELTQLINDQAANGVYQTSVHQVEKPDPITGEKKQVAEVEIKHDATGLPLRQAVSTLKIYGVSLLPVAVKEIRYDSIVEAQIAERQKATTQVQIAIANARKAEQDAITIAKQGEAQAAQAKWEQEKLKATAVTEAQQKLEVATLSAKEAEQYKREQVLRGEGEAERRRLVMSADGALDQKVQAYIEVQKVWADAFSKFGGQMVPTVVTGGGMAGAGMSSLGSAQGFVELMTIKAAKDLGVDLTTAGRANTSSGKP